MSTRNAGSAHDDDLERESIQGLIEMLTMALLRLTSWEQRSGGKTCLYADRTYDQDALDSLQKRGFVKLGGMNKPIQLTEDGARAGESAAAAIDEMLTRAAEEMMREFVADLAKRVARVKATDAYRLRVEFVFDSDLSCWREIAVPNNFSFLDLHRLLMALWNFGDYHCFDFQMRHNGKKLVLTDEQSDMCIDAMFAGFRGSSTANTEEARADDVMLSDVFPRTKNVTYHYDYGDGWEFKIKYLGMMGDVVESPYLLDGGGDCPPEDVGGEWGFINFLKIINNPDDPEYEEMKAWSEDQCYEKYEPIRIDSRLEAWYWDEYDNEDDELAELMESLGSEEAFIEYLAKMSLELEGDEDDEDKDEDRKKVVRLPWV